MGLSVPVFGYTCILVYDFIFLFTRNRCRMSVHMENSSLICLKCMVFRLNDCMPSWSLLTFSHMSSYLFITYLCLSHIRRKPVICVCEKALLYLLRRQHNPSSS